MWKEKMETAMKLPSEEEQFIMNSENLGTDLKYVHRILNQGTYHK